MPHLSLLSFIGTREKKEDRREGVREGERKGKTGNLIKAVHSRTKK